MTLETSLVVSTPGGGTETFAQGALGIPVPDWDASEAQGRQPVVAYAVDRVGTLLVGHGVQKPRLPVPGSTPSVSQRWIKDVTVVKACAAGQWLTATGGAFLIRDE